MTVKKTNSKTTVKHAYNEMPGTGDCSLLKV